MTVTLVLNIYIFFFLSSWWKNVLIHHHFPCVILITFFSDVKINYNTERGQILYLFLAKWDIVLIPKKKKDIFKLYYTVSNHKSQSQHNFCRHIPKQNILDSFIYFSFIYLNMKLDIFLLYCYEILRSQNIDESSEWHLPTTSKKLLKIIQNNYRIIIVIISGNNIAHGGG